MNYEKEYNNALERAKQAIKGCGDNQGRKNMIYSIFPELKESEDERTRKEILAFIIDMDCKERWIHWLEKQKEQKSTEWSEEYREEDLRTRFAFYTYKDEDSVLYLSNVFVEEASRGAHFGTRILRGAERLAEVIGASTIRLKVKQDSPANAWYRKHGYGYMTFEDGYDWLEKNLEYMKPNIHAEWSEKEERHKIKWNKENGIDEQEPQEVKL